MQCPNCHAEVEPDYEFCPECGYRLTPGVPETSVSSPQVISPISPQEPSASVFPPPVTPTVSPSFSSAPSPSPKKSKKGIWVIAGVLALLACLCVGGIAALVATGTIVPAFLSPSTPAAQTPSPSGPAMGNAAEAPVKVVNRSDTEICYLLISPSASEDWGDDWLGADETIPPGGSKTVWVPANDVYDLQVLDCNQDVLDEQYEIMIDSDGVTYTVGATP